jgi:PKD repeat protein
MKNNIFQSLTVGLALSVLSLASCKKSDLELSGGPSTAGFSFTQSAASDTLPYPYVITFNNESEGEFLYQWNFGDNTALSSEKNPVHTYKVGGSFNVTLTTVGTNGNNSLTKVVAVSDACSNDFFNKLTNCTYGEWTWSNDGDAIRILAPDETSVYFAGAPANCQVDDVYRFGADGTFLYDANGQTFDVQAGYSCQAPKANSSSYKVVAKPGERPVILLAGLTAGVGRPFIGTTDVVEADKYTVMSYTSNTIVLRSIIEGSGGVILEVKLRKNEPLTLAEVKNILTGGSSRGWKLDPAPGANAITVGTEGNPAEYYGGGPLEPNCQIDDIYTFTSTDLLSYNANGSTFNGGNISPNYNCGSDRSYSNLNYTFGPVTGGAAGLAFITIPQAPPATFIGTTDVPTENQYRIMDITPNRLILRAGNGSGVVFQFRFIPQ